MAFIDTDDSNRALSADYFAIITHFFYRCPDFHHHISLFTWYSRCNL